MQHIYVNFKRFDVTPDLGGVNRLSTSVAFGYHVVAATLPYISQYEDVEFVDFLPEAQIVSALDAAKGSRLTIGSEGVYRKDLAVGGNFGAFTTNRPAAIVKSLGCGATLIGHCEERMDKNELLAMGGNKDRKVVNTIFNEEIRCALAQGLKVLYCIGEKSEEVEDWEAVIKEQLTLGLKGLPLDNIAIAYEPVWSIGPGKTPADKAYITKVARLVKETIGDVPVVYGGGLKEANAEMLSSIPEIDGGLIALTRFSGDIGFYPEEYGRIISLYMQGKKEER